MKIFGAIAVLVLGVVAMSSAVNINFKDGETGLMRAFKWIRSELDGSVDDVKNGTVPKEFAAVDEPPTTKPTKTVIGKRSVDDVKNGTVPKEFAAVDEPPTTKPTETVIGKRSVELTFNNATRPIRTRVMPQTVERTGKPTKKPIGKPVGKLTGTFVVENGTVLTNLTVKPTVKPTLGTPITTTTKKPMTA